MSEKKESSVSSPSLAGEETLPNQLPQEVEYHDTDVFGHEEDHEVRTDSKPCVDLWLFLKWLLPGIETFH